jgi:hypothetical protein
MSSTEIKGLRPGNSDDPSDTLLQLQNAWGSAPIIWKTLYAKYVGTRNWMLDERNLWPLWKDPRVPRHQRAILGLTYDRAYVERQHFAQAAADLRQFMVDFPPEPDKVHHLAAIADLLASEPDYAAIGFHWTSVNEDPWACQWRESEEDDDEGEEESLAPFDWDECWSLYANLPAVEGQEAVA